MNDNITDWAVAKKLLIDAYGNTKVLWMYSSTKTQLQLWRERFSDKDLRHVEFALEEIRGLQEILR